MVICFAVYHPLYQLPEGSVFYNRPMAKNNNPMDEKDLTTSPEEATLEQEATAEVKEDEIREKLAG